MPTYPMCRVANATILEILKNGKQLSGKADGLHGAGPCKNSLLPDTSNSTPEKEIDWAIKVLLIIISMRLQKSP